jgi:hypothetical protein
MNFDNIRMCNLQFNLNILFCTMGKKRKKIQMNGRYTMYKMYIKKLFIIKACTKQFVLIMDRMYIQKCIYHKSVSKIISSKK